MKRVHGGNIREIKEKYNLKKIIDFSSNINFLGFSTKGFQAVKDGLNEIQFYPDSDCKYLKEELANYHHIDPRNIILGNGSVELIYLISKVLGSSKTLIPSPTFIEYELAVLAAKGKPQFVRLLEKDHFQLNKKEVLRGLDEVQALFLNNPNNPTGILYPKQDLLKIIQAAKKKKVFVIIDEAFMDFVEDEDRFSLLPQATRLSNLFVIRSFTKFFAIPGLRLGYAVGSQRLIKMLVKFQEPWTVNSLAQKAGVFSLKDNKYIQKTREFIKKERNFLFNKLSKIKGIKPFPPAANFIFIKLMSANAEDLKAKLVKQGIIIRNCSSFRFLNNKYIRVAIKKHKDNLYLLKFLNKYLDQ